MRPVQRTCQVTRDRHPSTLDDQHTSLEVRIRQVGVTKEPY
jgi:hypothetical protein